MCYSVEVEKDLKRIKTRFHTEISVEDEQWYNELKSKSDDLDFVKAQLQLKRKSSGNFFKEPGEDNRIYPGYFSWVMVEEKGRRVLKKMRYRIRPRGSSEEIPTKFNVFNARMDSLLVRPTWKKVFGNQHGIFPFTRFYEWVENNGRKRQISFSPQGKEIMWAPCVWDYWESYDKSFGFYSFAIITDDPPPEVLSMGHDRCPIFLQEHNFGRWLNPKGMTKEEMIRILQSKELVYFENAWAA